VHEVWTLRFLIGWAFDTYINLRYCIKESVKEMHAMVDDALDAWGDDDE